jgi:hypothetical protein
MVYLVDILGSIGMKVDETKKYIFVFFRKMKDIVMLQTSRPSETTRSFTIEKIPLTLYQKAIVKDYWRARIHDRSTFHNIVGVNHEIDVIQDQPQTEHVHMMMSEIFKRDDVYVSALQEPRENKNCRYILLIGSQNDLSVSNMRIFTFELHDLYR